MIQSTDNKYKITQYSYKMAKELGVTITPSLNSKKKIDVYKDNKRIVSIGAIGMMDYPNWIHHRGKQYADERRRLYKKRHDKNRHIVGSAGWYADRILW